MSGRITTWIILGNLFFSTLFFPPESVAQARKNRPSPTIPLNEAISSSISVVQESPAYEEFELSIPESVFALDIRIDHAPADVDLLLFDTAGELVTYAERSIYNEVLRISRISDPPLQTGRYRLEVAYQYSTAPHIAGETLTEIPFELTVNAITPEVVASLRPGDSHRGRLRPETAMVEMFQVDVPTGSPALRIDISDTDADLDLFVQKDQPVFDPFGADYRAQSVRSTEVMTIDRTSAPPLRPGRYYVLVIDQISDNYPADYRITISDHVSPPAALSRPTTPPVAGELIDRPLLSTVEILTYSGGGSGVVVSPRGHILTNRHVILDDSGFPATDITVGFSTDYGRPPEELYLAEVIDTAEDRDLALLQIVSGRYGEDLEDDESFVYLERRIDSIPEIGETLRFTGYPSIGGTGSRVSITFTRGTVSGYQDVPFGRLIKTDAEINEGSSGGAALDESFRLVGLPTEVVGLDAGQLAFIYPVSAIPEEWEELIAP